MIRGSEDWLVRALTDWVLTVNQGLALVTYRSFNARKRVLQRLEAVFAQKQLSTETLECKQGMQEQFVASVAHGSTDVLFVLDPQRLLFGERNDQSSMWVNFHRETLVARPGAQIWWFLPPSAIQFATQLPDLNRFFLFREDLTEVDDDPTSRELLPIQSSQQTEGSLATAQLYLDRALKAAAGTAARERIWLELGVPALRQFLQVGQPVETSAALDALSLAIGDPLELQGRANGKPDVDWAGALLVVGGAYLDGIQLKDVEKGDKAKKCFWIALEGLEAMEQSAQQQAAISMAMHRLGRVSEEEGDFASAREWYLKSLAIKEKQGNLHGAASSYHHLGTVAQEERDFEGARQWYLKSLAISKELGNSLGEASSYSELGRVAQEERDFTGAREWYLKSLAVFEKQGNLHGAAVGYQLLGGVAGEEQDFAGAREWYLKSLAVFQKQGNLHAAATTYHKLGMLAQEEGDFGLSREWHQKSLAISLKQNNLHAAAICYGQLGLLAGMQGHFEESGKWLIRSIVAFRQTNDERSAQLVIRNFQIAHKRAPAEDQQKLEAQWRDAGLGEFPTSPLE